LGGTGRGQVRIHMPFGYAQKPVASRLFGVPPYFSDNNLVFNTLCRIP
jgi:hypothetical protein